MKFKLIMSGLAAFGVMAGTSGAFAQEDAVRNAMAERLAPVGQVCLQGQDCGTASAPAAASNDSGDGDIDGEGIYNNVCSACHDTGAAGAPIRGDEDAWAARTEQGFATLLDHSINGIGAMPARGGNPNLSDEEMEVATKYMVEPVMDVSDVGSSAGNDEAASEETAATDEDEAASTQDDMAVASEEAAAGTQESEAATASTDSGLDGEALYSSLGCVACHANGVAGAPVYGDAEAWAPRIEQGNDALYQSVYNGKGAMPPRGGSGGSDEEIQAAVDHMVAEAQ
ncbi:c-type cytochrome [Halomonas vilamensis]|uniref:C-type cytochrome n=1 Tax=Vreelandella vilamensis TaxID=531309 RepID=A0ABU1H574_9GAMM|nr:c-type cytochrome [Halomonas vilamensis]MDR5899453.1 c-type cytochrome [Halomonas vilamensis]